MKELRGLDLKRALLVPSSVFASPEEVLYQGSLSVAQKLAILRRWEFDATRVAGHGPGTGDRRATSFVLRVQRAIQRLTQSTPASSWRRGPGTHSRPDELRSMAERAPVVVKPAVPVRRSDVEL